MTYMVINDSSRTKRNTWFIGDARLTITPPAMQPDNASMTDTREYYAVTEMLKCLPQLRAINEEIKSRQALPTFSFVSIEKAKQIGANDIYEDLCFLPVYGADTVSVCAASVDNVINSSEGGK